MSAGHMMIVTESGNELTTGLESHRVSDAAVQAAQRMANNRGESVWLCWVVNPGERDEYSGDGVEFTPAARIVWGSGPCLQLRGESADHEDVAKVMGHLVDAGLATRDDGLADDAWVVVSTQTEGELDLMREVVGYCSMEVQS